MAQLKEALREQSLLIRMDEERSVAAIPKLLPADKAERARIWRAVQRLIGAQGKGSDEVVHRLARIEKLLAVPAAPADKEGANAAK
jgi:hypothetical protein